MGSTAAVGFKIAVSWAKVGKGVAVGESTGGWVGVSSVVGPVVVSDASAADSAAFGALLEITVILVLHPVDSKTEIQTRHHTIGWRFRILTLLRC